MAYAAALLKREGIVSKVYTRAHRGDIYQKGPRSYSPLKRELAHEFDGIFSVSEDGKMYLSKTFGIPDESIIVSRLGVDIADHMASVSVSGVINLLSVSFCVPIKRLEKIVSAVSMFAEMDRGAHQIKWTHIGDGPLRNEIEERARSVFQETGNVVVEFLGAQTNSAVLGFYKENDVDVFVNASDSEGIPVSMMEAMSYGVPCIAPSVGGIPELLGDESELLLSAAPSTEEIADALSKENVYKNKELRYQVRRVIEEEYNAKRNYKEFISTILERE